MITTFDIISDIKDIESSCESSEYAGGPGLPLSALYFRYLVDLKSPS